MLEIPLKLKDSSGNPKKELKDFRKHENPASLDPKKPIVSIKVNNVYESYVPYLKDHLYGTLDDEDKKVVHFELDKDKTVYFSPATDGAIQEVWFYTGATVKIVKNELTSLNKDIVITNYNIVEVKIEEIINNPSLIIETYSPRHPHDSYSY